MPMRWALSRPGSTKALSLAHDEFLEILLFMKREKEKEGVGIFQIHHIAKIFRVLYMISIYPVGMQLPFYSFKKPFDLCQTYKNTLIKGPIW